MILALAVAVAGGVALGRRSVQPPAQVPAEPVPGTGAGPARVTEGVPVGYSRSEEGAVAAAANYTRVLGDKANLDPAFGERAYPQFAVPAVAEDLLRRSRESSASGIGKEAVVGEGVALRGAPLGYRVESYIDDAATVSVWYVAVGVGPPHLPMTTAWGTDRISLAWLDGDWKIADISSSAGPEPPSSVADPADSDLAAAINGFTPFTYAPAAAP